VCSIGGFYSRLLRTLVYDLWWYNSKYIHQSIQEVCFPYLHGDVQLLVFVSRELLRLDLRRSSLPIGLNHIDSKGCVLVNTNPWSRVL
jgi:hypothetical protein